MDIYFDIQTEMGSLLRVALSCYDLATLQYFTSDPAVLTLNFYDVSLRRLGEDGAVGQRALNAVSRTPASSLDDNEDAVLCFYCDEQTDIRRNDVSITPQEYRSRLFSAMFDRYVRSHKLTDVINYRVKIVKDDVPHFAHMICRRTHLRAAEIVGDILIEPK